MPTANETLQDRAIRHATYLSRYSRAEVAKILAFLRDEVEPELFAQIEKRLERIATRGLDTSLESTKRLEALHTEIRAIIAQFALDGRRMVAAELRRLAKAEAAWQAKALSDAIPAALGVEVRLPAPATLRAIVNEGPINGALLKDWFKTVEQGTLREVTRRVNIGLTSGQTTREIVRDLRGTPGLDFGDGALAGTRTQVSALVRTATAQVSTNARAQTARENKSLIKGEQWVATLDHRTCFPAGTLVRTPSGATPIERVRPGDLVLTHMGRPRRVVQAWSRNYTGEMVTVQAEGGRAVTMTPDHMVLLGFGVWQEASDLRPGDRVASLGHALNEAPWHPVGHGPLELVSDNPHHDVALGPQAHVSPRISGGGLGVPVGAIDLQRDPAREHEVHGVAANADLVCKGYAEPVEAIGDVALGAGPGAPPAVAGERAVAAPADLAGGHPPAFAASLAVDVAGRSPAGFGAVAASAPAVHQEPPAASRAVCVERLGRSAPRGAVLVPVGVGCGDAESHPAGDADLFDPTRPVGDVAGPGAEPVGPGCAGPERSAALRAVGADSGEPVCVSPHDPIQPVVGQAVSVSVIGHAYVENLPVFCLRVEEDGSYEAGGIVVHNCPVCGPLDGKVFDLGQGQRPPAHPNCRCTAVPVLKSWDEIIGRKVDPSKIPVGTRASMDGQVPADLTFNQWLKQQPLDGIADVLGSKKAARLFKAGELKLDQFSTATGKPLSLKQVMALEGM